ncbi:Fungal specific transcription factor domain-containing protein [Cladophialophora immunda]|nr:Fungal specific transcription factor domain-containing protein [Cladophialophora immunda]
MSIRNSLRDRVEAAYDAYPVHFASAYLDPLNGPQYGSVDTVAMPLSSPLALQRACPNEHALDEDFNAAAEAGSHRVALRESEDDSNFWFDSANNHQATDILWNAAEAPVADMTFADPWLAPPGPAFSVLDKSQEQGRSRERLPNGLLDKVCQCWSTTMNVGANGSQLWDQIIDDSEDDTFSQPMSKFWAVYAEQSAASRWKFDESCRWRIMTCLRGAQLESRHVTSQLTSINAETENDQESWPDVTPQDRWNGNHGATMKVPSISTLDFSLDLFFDHLHTFVPVIHVPTFDARKAPDVLLLALCMAGFVRLKGPAAQQFLEKNLTALVDRCRQALRAATVQTTTAPMLPILASSYLAMLSALLTGRSNTESCRRLHRETVSAMIAHGFFENEVVSATESGASDEALAHRYGWEVWARVESTKRLIIAIVMVDAFYSNSQGLIPTIPTEMLNLYLPCDEELFFAPSEVEWRRILQTKSTNSSATLAFCADQVLISPQTYYPGSVGLHGVLAAVWIRLSEAHHRILSRSGLLGHEWGLIPYEVYSTDHTAKSIAPFLVNFMRLHGRKLQNGNPHALIMWNILCVMLLSNSWMFELGAGQKGAEAAKAALACITSWSDTLAARRACVHAAQIFWICSKGKISDRMMLHSETSLFLAALVLGLYVLVMKADTDASSQHNVYELLGDMDWRDLGDVALGSSLHHGLEIDVAPEAGFIVHGGTLTFDGVPLSRGYSSARRILVHFANLLEGVGMWCSSDISRVLHIIGDVLTDEGVEHGANDPVAFRNYQS